MEERDCRAGNGKETRKGMAHCCKLQVGYDICEFVGEGGLEQSEIGDHGVEHFQGRIQLGGLCGREKLDKECQ